MGVAAWANIYKNRQTIQKITKVNQIPQIYQNITFSKTSQKWGLHNVPFWKKNNDSKILLRPTAMLVVFHNIANNFLSSAAGVPVIAISTMMGSLRFSQCNFSSKKVHRIHSFPRTFTCIIHASKHTLAFVPHLFR